MGRVGAWLLLGALSGAPLSAEPERSAVRGVVFDPSGAVIPGASVTLKKDHGAPAATTTDAQGGFSFEGLAPGRFEIEVRQDGFQPSTARIAVGARPVSPLKITLQLAGVVEEVTVRRGSSRAGENRDAVAVDRNLLDDIPAFDQDYIATLSAFLDPGALDAGGVSLVVDGAEANRLLVSPSAIQEVRINQNPYSAEYYRPGRGRIEIVTKQGSPEYHGTFNVLFRDSSLNAREFFAPQKAPEQRRIYEGYLAGPVAADKATSFQLSLNRKEDDVQSIVVAAGPGGPIRQNVPTPQRSTEFSARLTRQLGPRHTVWAEYALEDLGATNQGAGGFALPEAAANSSYHEDDLDVSDQFVITPKVINQLYLHFEWNHGSTTSLSSAPRILVQDAFTGGGAQADQRSTEVDFKAFENFSWSVGKHLVKAGFHAAEWSHRTYDDLSNRGGTYSFSSLADYEAGRPFAFSEQVGDGHVALLQEELAGFLQDEVQLKPSLSVAVGVRYDYQSLLHGGHLAPRVFAAFAPNPSHTVVLRAGIGFFNERFPPSTFAETLRYDGRHLKSYLLLNPGYPDPTGGTGTLATQPSSLTLLDPGIRVPYSAQYSLGAEWQVSKATTVSATYRGSRGIALLRSLDINAPEGPAFAQRPDPALARVRQIESAGRQVADALELSFRGKVGKSFTGLAQYTLSRTDNNTSGVSFFPADSRDPLAEWGPADFDQRHRLNLLGTLAVRKLLRVGIALSAASGKPYTLTTGRDDNHDGFATDRPFGVPRNGLRAPGFADLDLKVSREFLLDRAKQDKGPKATAGLELFNVFNAYDPTVIVGNLSSVFFGQAVAARPARRLQFSGRFTF